MRKFTTLLVMVIIAGGCRTVDERRTADAQPMRDLTFHLMTAITEPDPSLSKAERDRLDAEYNKTYRDAFINDTREYGVTWPKGSDAVADYWCATITVTNTPENLIKIIGHERLLSRRWRKITVNARFVEADHKALEAVGLDSMKRIDDADAIFEQLKKRDDVRLLEAFRQNAKNGQECVLKRVTEYIYPTEFNVVSDGAASASNSTGPSHNALARRADAVRLSPREATRAGTPSSRNIRAITKPSPPLFPGPQRISASRRCPARQMICAAAAPARSISS